MDNLKTMLHILAAIDAFTAFILWWVEHDDRNGTLFTVIARSRLKMLAAMGALVAALLQGVTLLIPE
jgi:hypothetical protein